MPKLDYLFFYTPCISTIIAKNGLKMIFQTKNKLLNMTENNPSAVMTITRRVPQGSILGSLLFIL